MLYYLGSHRWLWGRGGWGSQRANALPPVSLRSLITPFTPAAHVIHTPATPSLRTLDRSSISVSCLDHSRSPSIRPPVLPASGGRVTSLLWFPGPPVRTHTRYAHAHTYLGRDYRLMKRWR